MRRGNEKEHQGQLLHFEKERIHGDWASFSLGPFLSVKKKRCQRQIIYFCRRSVIKVFAPTGFLRPPITGEIIIIGPQSLALLSMTKNAKKDLSVGNVLRANIGGNKKNILRLSQEHCVLFDMKLSFSIH